ncbi:MAG TPA: site-specific integrase, partial [Nitrososphaeraceae archaeon]|nr:site-specific integrase [Nitrososphaeraceae archaeon]
MNLALPKITDKVILVKLVSGYVAKTEPKTALEIALSARRVKHKQIDLFPKVRIFLDSIARNSIKSKISYSSGLNLLQSFLNANVEEQKQRYNGCNCETILQPLFENKVNVYELLDSFVSFVLTTKPDITPKSLSLYLTAIKSYFAFYDIDVIPTKFRRKVKVPKFYREDEEPLDVNDIRKLLLNCNNRRLKAYLLILTSGAMRAMEALAIRLKDIDFSPNPTKIHIRKEFAKTRVARDIYISNEATVYLKQWIDWKYRDKGNKWTRDKSPDDLVFSIYSVNKKPNPSNLYIKILLEFQKLLEITGMAERKESGIHKRRKITLHSLRRHAKGIISNQVNQDYSEWFIGHSKSPYYTLKESERREIYAN